MNDREIFRTYGVTTPVFFELRDITTDNLFSGASFVSGDVQVSLNGAAFADVTTDPVEIASTGIYRWNPSTPEMQINGTVILKIIDAATKVWKDKVILLFTGGVDVSAISQNTAMANRLETYLTLLDTPYLMPTPTPTKTVFKVSGGVTIDAYKNYVLVFTTGANAGVAKPVLSYVGSTQILTLAEELPYTPADGDDVMLIPAATIDFLNIANTALASIPNADTASCRDLIKLLANIAKGKKIETPTLQTIRNEGDGADLGTRSIAKVSTTLTVGKLT